MNSRENIRLCLESMYDIITSLHQLIQKLIALAEQLEGKRQQLFDALEFMAYRFSLALCPYTRLTVIAPAVGNKRETEQYIAFSKALQQQENGKSTKFRLMLEEAICVPLTRMIMALTNSLHSLRRASSRGNGDPLLQLTAVRSLISSKIKFVVEAFFAAISCQVSHALSSWVRAPSVSEVSSFASIEWSGASTSRRDALAHASKLILRWRASFDDMVVQVLRCLAKMEELVPLVFTSSTPGQAVDPVHARIHQVNKNMNLFFHKNFLPFHHKIVNIAEKLKSGSSTMAYQMVQSPRGKADIVYASPVASIPSSRFLDQSPSFSSPKSPRDAPPPPAAAESPSSVFDSSSQESMPTHVRRQSTQSAVTPQASTRSTHGGGPSTFTAVSREASSHSVPFTIPAVERHDSSSLIIGMPTDRRVRFSTCSVGTTLSFHSIGSNPSSKEDKYSVKIQAYITTLDQTAIYTLKKLLRSLETD